MALAESNCRQKEQVAGARKDFEIHTTLRNSPCCTLTDVTCLNTSNKQESTTSEAAHFICRLWHSLESPLVRLRSIIPGLIVLGCPLGTT